MWYRSDWWAEATGFEVGTMGGLSMLAAGSRKETVGGGSCQDDASARDGVSDGGVVNERMESIARHVMKRQGQRTEGERGTSTLPAAATGSN